MQADLSGPDARGGDARPGLVSVPPRAAPRADLRAADPHEGAHHREGYVTWREREALRQRAVESLVRAAAAAVNGGEAALPVAILETAIALVHLRNMDPEDKAQDLIREALTIEQARRHATPAAPAPTSEHAPPRR